MTLVSGAYFTVPTVVYIRIEQFTIIEVQNLTILKNFMVDEYMQYTRFFHTSHYSTYYTLHTVFPVLWSSDFTTTTPRHSD